MGTIAHLTSFLTSLTLLASCSAPPKPPTVDESQRRPANSTEAVELQVCKGELENTRLLATECGRLADAATSRLSAVRQILAKEVTPPTPAAQANTVYTVRFGFGSTRLEADPGAFEGLIKEAKAAPLVVLRGRTDGNADSLPESRVARERAAAVRDLLVSAGVDASRLRTTHQPSGDHVAENVGASGRALNRRVEIEIYRAFPVSLPIERERP